MSSSVCLAMCLLVVESLFCFRAGQPQTPAKASNVFSLLVGKGKVEASISKMCATVLPAALEANLCRVLAALNQMMLMGTSLTLQVRPIGYRCDWFE